MCTVPHSVVMILFLFFPFPFGFSFDILYFVDVSVVYGVLCSNFSWLDAGRLTARETRVEDNETAVGMEGGVRSMERKRARGEMKSLGMKAKRTDC